MIGRLALMCAMLAACGDGPPDGLDAEPADGGADAGPPPVEPVLPDPPRLAPCPPGWRAVPSAGGAGTTVCDPFPEGGPADCAPWEAHFPGTTGCVAVGSPCPADGWPADLPPSGVRYVQAGAAAGGDGSRAAPYATIADALLAAGDGETIALAAGTYRESVRLRGVVTVAGACAERTVIEAPPPEVGATAVFVTLGATVTVRDLRVTGSSVTGFDVAAAELTVSGVAIHDVRERGLAANSGARVTARDIAIRRVAAPRGAHGIGVYGSRRAEIVLSRAVIEDTVAIAINIEEGRAELEDVAVRRVRIGKPPREDLLATGLLAYGGDVTASRIWISGAEGLGIYVVSGILRLEDVVVRDVRPGVAPGGQPLADGIQVDAGSTLSAMRLLVDGAPHVGVSIIDARAMLSDVLVRGPPPGAAAPGRGIEVTDDPNTVQATEFTAARLAVEGGAEVAILADGAGTSVEVTDLGVTETGSNGEGMFGRAVQVQRGSAFDGTRVLLERSREVSALVSGTGSTLHLEELTIRDTLPSACVETTCPGAGAGTALAAIIDGHASAVRFLLTRSALCGIQLARGGTADLSAGEVSSNLVGANVQTAGFDIARISGDVVYRDNERDLDTTELAVPDPMLGR